MTSKASLCATGVLASNTAFERGFKEQYEN